MSTSGSRVPYNPGEGISADQKVEASGYHQKEQTALQHKQSTTLSYPNKHRESCEAEKLIIILQFI